MRGRKPLPTSLKLVKGNPGHRPLNENEVEPEIGERPEPPDFLSEDARAEWDHMLDRMWELGLVTDIDTVAFAAYCQAYARWAQAERALSKMAAADPVLGAFMVKTANGNPIQNPLVGVANHAMSDAVKYAAEFGMTPSARSRIDIGIGARGGSGGAENPEQGRRKTGTAADFFT